MGTLRLGLHTDRGWHKISDSYWKGTWDPVKQFVAKICYALLILLSLVSECLNCLLKNNSIDAQRPESYHPWLSHPS